ncbi:glycosyltransferase [Streptomyces sp. NPDC008150]|uniref:glycosyltransferase n=1 Tax=Streptomyces sp. NPDC008150 TaxID=3364816 RepID=UPI0036E91881
MHLSLDSLAHLGKHAHWYGLAVGALLGTKLLLSIRRRRQPDMIFQKPLNQHVIHGVVTTYNEAPAMLRRCLESILGQTLTPQSLTIVDDCSSDQSAHAVVEEMRPKFEEAGIRLDFIRFAVNQGKRHGLAAGFREAPEADAYLCVDSDTVLDEHAVAELAEPFSKRRVQCVTGLVLAHNRSVNLLTRLIDMRYVNAFLGERVAYSRLGSVLCACGSLAMYRGWVVRKHLDDFLDQRFLGLPATFGDDRRLTYYCLTEGLSLIQPSSVGYTDVPERLNHYIRQQVRWGKSFIREGFLLLGKFRVSRMYWWLNLIELVTWVAFTVALLASLFAIVLHPTGWQLLATYLAYMCVMAWVRSIHYLRGAAGVGPLDRTLTFLAAPLYALMNLCLLLPLRLWSLATLRQTKWGTRSTVEVGEAESVTGTAPAESFEDRGDAYARPGAAGVPAQPPAHATARIPAQPTGGPVHPREMPVPVGHAYPPAHGEQPQQWQQNQYEYAGYPGHSGQPQPQAAQQYGRPMPQQAGQEQHPEQHPYDGSPFAYGAQDMYGAQGGAYGTQQPYGSQDPYGAQGGHGEYAGHGGHNTHDPYGNPAPYAPPAPYGVRDDAPAQNPPHPHGHEAWAPQ